MRIVAGRWRGRALQAPPGQATRPTADRVRQALFDMLLHAPWGGPSRIGGAFVLDVFAGTGALGLEALSRGAACACFIEQDSAALRVLRANIAACGADDRAVILAGDALSIAPAKTFAGTAPEDTPHYPGHPGPARRSRGHAGAGERDAQRIGVIKPSSLVFLDPPYGQMLVPRALENLLAAGHVAPGALIIAETGRAETWAPEQPLLAERQHGAARILVFQAAGQ